MKFTTNKKKLTNKAKQKKRSDEKFKQLCKELEDVVASWKHPTS